MKLGEIKIWNKVGRLIVVGKSLPKWEEERT